MSLGQGSYIPSDVVWRKASRSVGQGACVEVATLPGQTAVRDSKNRSGPMLRISDRSWAAFVGTLKGRPRR